MSNDSFSYKLGAWLSRPARLLIFGFLVAREGVPFLPNDNLGALFITVVAGVVAVWPTFGSALSRANASVVSAIVSTLTMVIVLQMDRPTTSMVLLGAFVITLTRVADNYPLVYGLVLGVGVTGVLAQLFDLHPLITPKQTLLSGQPWSSDVAGHEMILLAGFMLLSALENVMRQQGLRLMEEKEAAEHARDAAIADERARIARELHDVVSHHVTAMTLQAEAVAMTGDKEALANVATQGREALTELRRMLGVLRHPEGAGANALEPQPGLEDLQSLAIRSSSGPKVHVERRGEVRHLSAGLELGVYRLVQEALTNSAKHGDATTVDVVLTYGLRNLTVDITDNGAPFAAARVTSSGLGLVGMSERIALLNGTLETGPRTDGSGFRVHAMLPIES